MSIYAMVWAYEQDVRNSGQKFTLVTAAQYCNDEGICWVGQETLADDMSMTARSVRSHLDALEECGLIERIERRRKDGTRTSDMIRLCGFQRKRKNLPVESASTGKKRQDQPENISGQKRQLETLDNYDTSNEVSSGIAPAGKPLPAEKVVADMLYDRCMEEGMRWNRDEYAFHLGRAKEMFDKDNPSDVEIEMLPDAFMEIFTVRGDRKADAVLALREIRRQEKRQGIIDGWQKDKEDKDNGVLSDEEQERRRIAREKVAKANEEMIRRFYEDE